MRYLRKSGRSTSLVEHKAATNQRGAVSAFSLSRSCLCPSLLLSLSLSLSLTHTHTHFLLCWQLGGVSSCPDTSIGFGYLKCVGVYYCSLLADLPCIRFCVSLTRTLLNKNKTVPFHSHAQTKASFASRRTGFLRAYFPF